MGLISNFISRNSKFLLFLFFEVIALTLIFNRNVYHNSVLENSVMNIQAKVENEKSKLASYFELKRVNEQLLKENTEYKNKYLAVVRREQDTLTQTTHGEEGDAIVKYDFKSATIVSNSINRKDNYIIIDRGSLDGVEEGMGILSTDGILGQVIGVTEHYAKVMSILNSNTNIPVKVSQGYNGTLKWDGLDSRIVKVIEVPKYARINIGDVVFVDSKSNIYPGGVPIGRISNKIIDDVSGNWDISVELFDNISKVSKGYIVNNLHKDELEKLTTIDSLTVN